jgi:hypothetical protein
MSLYLAIFDGDEEVEGWVLGHYSDFGAFRDHIARLCGNRFPTLQGASDCDATWTPDDAVRLRQEIKQLREALGKHPPIRLEGCFEHTAQYRARARTAADSFHNVDGENLLDALDRLCERSIKLRLNIVFQ